MPRKIACTSSTDRARDAFGLVRTADTSRTGFTTIAPYRVASLNMPDSSTRAVLATLGPLLSARARMKVSRSWVVASRTRIEPSAVVIFAPT